MPRRERVGGEHRKSFANLSVQFRPVVEEEEGIAAARADFAGQRDAGVARAEKRDSFAGPDGGVRRQFAFARADTVFRFLERDHIF